MSDVDRQAYCWLVYFAHHKDGSLRCTKASCPHCAAKEAADALWEQGHRD